MLEVFKALFSSPEHEHPLIKEATDSFLEMLDLGVQMLDKVSPSIMDHDVSSELLAEARSIDKSTNKLERSVRKLLVEHLAFDNKAAPTCLVLMSVIKDAERLVDECRNIIDLSTLLNKALPDQYRTVVADKTAEIKVMLQQTRDAFATQNEEQALALVEGEKPFIATLKPTQDQLLDDDNISSREAIVCARALLLIHRIAAHLSNIASTVVFPVHQIDFAKRKFVEEAKDRLSQ